MKNEFLTQMDERVKIVRSKAENTWETRRKIEKAKEYCIQNIMINWLKSIPEILEADGHFLVSTCVYVGHRGDFSYGFDLPDAEEVFFSNWSEAAGIVKEIVDKLSLMVKREVDYKVHRNRSGSWSLEVSFFY